MPELLIDFLVGIERPEEKLTAVPSHNVVPDFVSGWAFGQAVGIGLRSVGNWWTVHGASLVEGQSTVGLSSFWSHDPQLSSLSRS